MALCTAVLIQAMRSGDHDDGQAVARDECTCGIPAASTVRRQILRVEEVVQQADSDPDIGRSPRPGQALGRPARHAFSRAPACRNGSPPRA